MSGPYFCVLNCSSFSSLVLNRHSAAIPLRSWRSWSFFKLFQIAAEAWTRSQNLVLPRSQYASSTFRLRFCYEPITTMKIRLRLVYDAGDAAATLPRHRRWGLRFHCDLISFYIKSTVQLVIYSIKFQLSKIRIKLL